MTTHVLIALAGPLQGSTFPLESDTLTVGRHEGNDLVVRHLSVSRRHGRLERCDRGFRWIDLDSLFGTYVNDRAIRSCLLSDGDLITLGESLFLFQSVSNGRRISLGFGTAARAFEEASTAHVLPGMAGRLAAGASELRGEADGAGERALEQLVGESPRMDRLRALIRRIADVDTTVLIDGESGCGKELVARVLHETGPRARRPFVAINCATLSETLLESELFGHERGAFTGALEQRVGQFERADGGTIFLDEVGEIPLGLQARLLRVLQEREIERLGGRRTIPVNVRVLAATNRDLSKEIVAGRFRDDLFYRLNVIRLTVPPLRKRLEDIPLLASHFLFQHTRRLSRSVMGLSRPVKKALCAYGWPGNVRELSNVIERAVVLSEHPMLQLEDLPDSLLECRPESLPIGNFHGVVNQTKRELVSRALRETQGNITLAARELELSPNYLHRLIGNLGLRDQVRQARIADRLPGKIGL